MSEITEGTEKGTEEKGKVVEMKTELTPEQVSAEANKAEEETILKMLEDKYGLTQEAIDACKKVEADIGLPENNITMLPQAIDFYKKQNLSENQLTFMAINSNSKANFNTIKVNKLLAEVNKLEGVIKTMIKLSVPDGAKQMKKED